MIGNLIAADIVRSQPMAHMPMGSVFFLDFTKRPIILMTVTTVRQDGSVVRYPNECW